MEYLGPRMTSSLEQEDILRRGTKKRKEGGNVPKVNEASLSSDIGITKTIMDSSNDTNDIFGLWIMVKKPARRQPKSTPPFFVNASMDREVKEMRKENDLEDDNESKLMST
ncbi:hypothetical protein RJT34_30452 [Clitoria ternatea]|uniref:Uncharacterized protein n=1 Tax=Clitoria ternatea TaxID=43366 RepID=A0AAN9I7D4_CLITE